MKTGASIFYPLVFTVLIAMAVYYVVMIFQKSDETSKTQTENEFKSKHAELEQQLKRSKRERLVLVDSLNSYYLRFKAIDSLISVQDKKIGSIKGSFNNYTSTELENEMNRQYLKSIQ